MKKILFYTFIAVILAFVVVMSAQAQAPYRTRTFGFDWRNLQVFVEDNPLSPPVITMCEANRIII